MLEEQSTDGGCSDVMYCYVSVEAGMVTLLGAAVISAAYLRVHLHCPLLAVYLIASRLVY